MCSLPMSPFANDLCARPALDEGETTLGQRKKSFHQGNRVRIIEQIEHAAFLFETHTGDRRVIRS